MDVGKESIIKFLVGNRFHVKLRILGPYSNRIWFSLIYLKSIKFDLSESIKFSDRFLAYTHRGEYLLEFGYVQV